MNSSTPRRWLKHFLAWRAKHIPQRQFVLLLSIFIGLVTGVVSVLMKTVTHLIQEMVQTGYFTKYFNPYYFAFPVIGIIITVLIKRYFFKNRITQPIPSTLFAISRKNGFIEVQRMYSYFITSIFTVGFGGSVGLEGPAVGTGSAFGANLGRLFKLNYKTRLLMICCACAGAIASLFNAPIAAIIFTIEVFSIDLTFSSLIPLLLASASGAVTSIFIQGKSTMLHFKVTEAFNVSDLPFYLLLGVLCAFVSVYFTLISFKIERLFQRLNNYRNRMVVGSLLLGGLIFLVPPLYGEGYTTINHLLSGNIDAVVEQSVFSGFLEKSWMVLLLVGGLVFLKSFATSFTINAGGAGGIFAPSLFTGASLGFVFSGLINKFKFFDIPVSNFVLVGMAGLMAGALHAPLTAVFMIAEITGGYELFLPLMMVSAISFLVARGIVPNSIYTDQLAKRGDLLTHNKDQVILTLLNIEEVIEDNFNTVNPEMNMRDLVKVVSQSRRNIFPVVDDEHKLVGVLTLDDFRHLMFDESIYDTTYVSQLMNPPPAVIQRDEKMDEVMKKFQKTDAWNLPVVEGEVYKGFISKSKLFSVYRSMLIEFSD